MSGWIPVSSSQSKSSEFTRFDIHEGTSWASDSSIIPLSTCVKLNVDHIGLPVDLSVFNPLSESLRSPPGSMLTGYKFDDELCKKSISKDNERY